MRSGPYLARLDTLRDLASRKGAGAKLDVVILCPAAEAGGRPPGLYRTGPAGSSVGILVYDPAADEPDTRGLSPGGVVIGGDAAAG